jgi:hypothetical protein
MLYDTCPINVLLCNTGVSMKKLFTIILLFTLSTSSWSLQLKDIYTMDATNRFWYFGGIYDANLVQWNDGGKRSDCLEKLGVNGFVAKLSEFIVALPEDPSSKERKVYDEMNMATLSVLIIDKECVK